GRRGPARQPPRLGRFWGAIKLICRFGLSLFGWRSFSSARLAKKCPRLASEAELPQRNPTTLSPVITSQPNSADIVPAQGVALAAGEWGRCLTRALKVVLLLILLLWNLLLLEVLFTSM